MTISLLDYFSGHIEVYGFFGLIIATGLSIFFIPAIRELSMANNFTDAPSARKSHNAQVPVLGGVAIYAAAASTIAIISKVFPELIEVNVFTVFGFASIILVFVGIRDDLLGLKAVTKLIFQISIVFTVLYFEHFYIENMNGLLGLFELPIIPSLVLSSFVFIIFINMLNLIDGIDGLASGLSIVSFSIFAYVAWRTGSYYQMLLCMSAIGSLIPFIYYNMFSTKKIFLGDNGSLILGFTLGFLSLELLSTSNSSSISVFGGNTSLVLMSVFSFPLVDTLRVFTIRVLRKQSPFVADKNHIHHHLLRLGLLHRQATLIIIVYTILITIISLLLLEININIAFVILLTIAGFIILLPVFLVRKTDGSIKFKK